jgi:hypothetical protein
MKKFKLLRGYVRPNVDLDLQREITSRIMRQSRMINEINRHGRADHIFLNTEWVTREILGITEE